MRYALTYDEGWWDEAESICEEFETIEELLKRYEEIKWEVCEIRAWDEEEEIKPWSKSFKK